MTEKTLKARLVKLLRETAPDAMTYRHEDKFTKGVPDISVSRNRRTAWVEVKFQRGTKVPETTDVQLLALRRLRGLLVTYGLQKDGTPWTKIVDYKKGNDDGGEFWEGHGHNIVVSRIQEILG